MAEYSLKDDGEQLFYEDVLLLDGDEDDYVNYMEEDLLPGELDRLVVLHKTTRYKDVMQKVEAASSNNDLKGYELVCDCNQLCIDIDEDISKVHDYIRDMYRSKFLELESLVTNPVDYCRVVKQIGNELDLTIVDLEGILPSALIMVVSITASTTRGKPMSDDVLQKTMDACDRVLNLDSAKKKLIEFLERQMGYIAPNLCAVVGSLVAAKLMVTAGGLSELANMPACNVQLLGDKKKNLAGFSKTSDGVIAYLDETDIFQNTPPLLRNRVYRLLAAKSTLAARVDSNRGDPCGKTGMVYRAEIHKKIGKWQEASPGKQVKPLLVPEMTNKKKRGGRRSRKYKERYGITEMPKMMNRTQFGIAEESSLGDGYGEGYGMLCAKLRLPISHKNKLPIKPTIKLKSFGNSASCGMISGLAFELRNPLQPSQHIASGTQTTYFQIDL